MPFPDDIAGGPLHWLQQGRTPVARCPGGILRLGPPDLQKREQDARHTLPESLRRFAPTILGTHHTDDQVALLEEDLGDVPGGIDTVDAFHATLPGEQRALTDTVGALIEAAQPWSGRLKLTPFIRALRNIKRAGTPLPLVPSQQNLQRALSAERTIHTELGWIHGALTPPRSLSAGLCHWRHSRSNGQRAADRAPLLSVEEATDAELIHIVAQSFRTDPLRAAEAVAALGLGRAPPAEATLTVHAHPGLSPEDLAVVLGCPLSVPAPAARVARALGRARRLVIGGQPVEASASPALAARSDSRFWQPRGRDPRRLFSRWSSGVRLDEDEEARYSVTPEAMALTLAERLKVEGKVVVDGFCGAGGNAIAFARRGAQVIALDTDAHRLDMARHNAKLYGVEGRIQFVQGDFFHAAAEGDVVFLDPPWAGGSPLLDAAWAEGRRRFAAGAIKLPREHVVASDEGLSVWTTPEGFPAFVTVSWPRGKR
ncbi:MAG: precorrin-6B methylase 2 [Myxococcota bacterium]|jgi:precorrin-6B methylase 2